MKKEFVIPKIDIPFIEDDRFLKIEKKQLLSMIKYFARDSRYRLPRKLESDYSIRKMLSSNQTLCKRLRDERLQFIDRKIYKQAA